MIDVVPRRPQHRDPRRSPSRPWVAPVGDVDGVAGAGQARRRAAACPRSGTGELPRTSRTGRRRRSGAGSTAQTPTSGAYSSRIGSTRSALPAREAQHHLGDADRLVVLELAGVGDGAERDDPQRRGITPDRFARALQIRAARRACRRRRSGSIRRRTRRSCANSFGPGARRRSAPAARRCVTGFGHDHDGGICTNSPSNEPTSLSHSARIASTCSRVTARAVAASSRRGRRSRRRSNRTRCRARTARPTAGRGSRSPSRSRSDRAARPGRCPVPTTSRSVAAAAIESATNGSSVRLYSSRSSASPVGGGVSRLVGMCVCSGT